MWGLPEPGIEPVSPALAGGFLTPAPAGKTLTQFLIVLSVFLFLSFKSSLHILDNGTLANMSFANFSPCVWLAFSFF